MTSPSLSWADGVQTSCDEESLWHVLKRKRTRRTRPRIPTELTTTTQTKRNVWCGGVSVHVAPEPVRLGPVPTPTAPSGLGVTSHAHPGAVRRALVLEVGLPRTPAESTKGSTRRVDGPPVTQATETLYISAMTRTSGVNEKNTLNGTSYPRSTTQKHTKAYGR